MPCCKHACRWLGVQHVYLTENAAEPSPDMLLQLADFVDSGFITYTTEGVARAQTKVYYDCMRQHYHKHNWLAFFDIDEYLVLVDRRAPSRDSSAALLHVALQHPCDLICMPLLQTTALQRCDDASVHVAW